MFYPVPLVRSDLGVHVDGFISNVAHSLIVGVTKVRRLCWNEFLQHCGTYPVFHGLPYLISPLAILPLSLGQPTDWEEG